MRVAALGTAARTDQEVSMPSRTGDVRLPEVVVLDLDGTLVDSVYVHALAWKEAFREVGLDIATYRLHRAVGMGGDRLVAAVAGDAAEDAVGDLVRKLHGDLFAERLAEVQPLGGVTQLLGACHDHGLRMVLASSATPETTRRLLDKVEGAHLITAVVPGSQGPSKPAPDLVEQALDRAGSRQAFMVGDAVWDIESAQRAGIPCVGLLTGGYSEAELSDAGAVAVFDTPRSLAGRLDEVFGALG
jgi:phosphoglycolate phosphatase